MKQTLTASVCSLSWIDERSKLPEHDRTGPNRFVGRHSIKLQDDTTPYRFVNLLEGTIEFDSADLNSIKHSFTLDSGVYRNPSFAGIPSQAFRIQRASKVEKEYVVFTQTLGCRTVSPEVIGEIVGEAATIVALGSAFGPLGGQAGRKVAHYVKGFPPIWTTLELIIFFDGRIGGRVVAQSLFPSMTFYVQQPHFAKTAQYVQSGPPYDGISNLDRWNVKGWGGLGKRDPSGATEGNPWKFEKKDLP